MGEIITIPVPKYKLAAIQKERATVSRKIATHLGMQLVDSNGNPEPGDVLAVQHDATNKTVLAIRSALASGKQRVSVESGYRDVYEAVCAQLTRAERAKVHFKFFDTPEPTETKEAVIRGDEIWNALKETGAIVH